VTPNDASFAAAREENRKRYPEVARLVDKVREHFPNARVVAIRPRQERRTDLALRRAAGDDQVIED
jgi:hypothetical protein